MKKIKDMLLSSLLELKSTRNVVLCGLLAALGIVLGMVASISIGPYIRIGFSGLPNRIVDFLFGPVVGCIFGGALDILKYTKREAAGRLAKLLKSAIANWEAKNGADKKELENGNVIVKTICVNEGRTLKRIRTAPQGRAARIRKRSNHVTIILGTKAVKPAKEETK